MDRLPLLIATMLLMAGLTLFVSNPLSVAADEQTTCIAQPNEGGDGYKACCSCHVLSGPPGHLCFEDPISPNGFHSCVNEAGHECPHIDLRTCVLGGGEGGGPD